MNFADELKNNTLSDLTEIEKKQKNHVAEIDFIEHLIEEIKRECKKEAFNHRNMLERYLHKDIDHDYRLTMTNLNSVVGLCGGYFGTHYNEIRYEEDTDFIVRELRRRLISLGFSKVEVNLSYSDKKEKKSEWKKTFLSMKQVEHVNVYPNYYKNLYIKVSWE